ncbi:hypothetical protein IQ235_17275 [Oscillatoriales cyanobacterium LEGE 11467]|uniref:Uncharacterized protein n=1 Tax=Zarconia navalis LEGE 11467 TaxID=1828826 RepID=A0A928VZK8_9CYAN|nr:hypothetical protein [Zarconia navalis]MBE9042524.1 hypothetical protein [Zarconia navalis LEGE 11467]
MKQSGLQWLSKTIGKMVRSVWFFPVCLVFLKLWLTRDLPLITYFGSHDDLRYIAMANSFVNFDLPPYDRFTLMRQPGYPAYIALSYCLGLSLRFSQELLYLGSGLFLARSLYKYYPSRWVVTLFSALYILNPGSFHWNRLIMPEALYVPLTTFMLACLLHLIHSQRQRPFWKWSAILGLALAWFWNTRPEGVWIVPTIAFAYGIILFKKSVASQLSLAFFKTLFFSIFLVVAPVIFATSSICLLNYFNYGLYITNDLTAPGFKAAYAQIVRVNSDRFRRWVPVPQETRRQLYEVSPSFQQLSSFLETEKGQAWFALTCNERVNICDDYMGGVFLWALRDAVADSGYYQSAKETDRFYREIAEEIKIACEDDRLKCARSSLAFSSFSPQLRPQYIGYFFESLGILSQNSIGSALELNLTSGYENNNLYRKYYQKITRESLNFRNKIQTENFTNYISINLARIYGYLFPILLGMAILGVVLTLFKYLFFSYINAIPISIFIFFISCTIARVLLISYIRTVSMPVKGFRYLWPGVPFLLLSIAIGISYLEPILTKKSRS